MSCKLTRQVVLDARSRPTTSYHCFAVNHGSLELLELYLELILARFGLLEMNPKEKEPDEGVREAVCSIVYAAPRSGLSDSIDPITHGPDVTNPTERKSANY